MIIACPDEGWIIEAIRAEIVQRSVTKGDTFEERLANLATKPVLRMRASDGSSREWVLTDDDTPRSIINALCEFALRNDVARLPKGGALQIDDDDD